MITFSNFTSNLKKKWKAIIFLVNFALFIGLGLSLIQPFLYRTNFSILIIQDNKEDSDVYTSIKSADKLGILLQRIVKTTDFYDTVMSSGFGVSKDDFSNIESKKREQWNNMIESSLIQDTGILDFNVYYKNRAGAEEYAKAIIHSLINDGSKFYGATDFIKFRVIDTPLTSLRPAKPNIIFNAGFSICIGFILSMMYIYFTTTEKRKDVIYDEDVSKEIKKEVLNIKKEELINKLDINKLRTENIKELEHGDMGDVGARHGVPVPQHVPQENNNITEINSIPQEGFMKNLNDRVKGIVNTNEE